MITTVGVFSNSEDAESALCELLKISIPKREISYIYANSKKIARKKIIGEICGYVTNAGRLNDIDSLQTSGLFSEKLGFVDNSISVGFVGACDCFGVGEKDAKRFYEYVKGGDVLIFVCIQTPDSKSIFARTHAREIQEYTK